MYIADSGIFVTEWLMIIFTIAIVVGLGAGGA